MKEESIWIGDFPGKCIREKVMMETPFDFASYLDIDKGHLHQLSQTPIEYQRCVDFEDHLASRRTFPYPVKEDGKEISESEFRLRHQFRGNEEWKDCTKETYNASDETLRRIIAIPIEPEKPKIVCLCGSTRFMEAFQEANLKLTCDGIIVLSVGCNTKSDRDLLFSGELTEELKTQLDELHKRKIDLADEVFVLNVGGYIGESTRSEIEYAKNHNKQIKYLEP